MAEAESTPDVEVEVEVEAQVCDSCGRAYEYVWWAPHTFWNGLVDRHGAGKRCIDCFDRLLRGAGYFGRWTFEVVGVGTDPADPQSVERRMCPQGVAGLSHDRHFWHAGSTEPEYYWCNGWGVVEAPGRMEH